MRYDKWSWNASFSARSWSRWRSRGQPCCSIATASASQGPTDDGRGCRYRLSGEIDLATAPRLEADLDTLVADETLGVIVVDCDGLTFIDSSGMRALLTTQAALERRGRYMRAENVSPGILRIFSLVGIAEYLRANSEEP
jgi:anti-sigma B factor antagonist